MNHSEHTPNSETSRLAGKRAASWLVAAFGALAATAAFAQGAADGGDRRPGNGHQPRVAAGRADRHAVGHRMPQRLPDSSPALRPRTRSTSSARTRCRTRSSARPPPRATCTCSSSYRYSDKTLTRLRIPAAVNTVSTRHETRQPSASSTSPPPSRSPRSAAPRWPTKARSSSARAMPSRTNGRTSCSSSTPRARWSTDVVTQVPFNPATDFPGHLRGRPRLLRSHRFEFEQPTQPATTTTPCRLPRSSAMRRITAMASAGYYVADRAAQWRGSGPRWRGINGNTAADVWVECKTDAGVHGNGVNFSRLWAADAGNGPWTSSCEPGDHLDCERREPGLRLLLGQLHQLAAEWQHDHADTPADRAAGRDHHDQLARRGRRGQRRPDAVQQQHEQWLRQHRDLGGRHGAARRSPRSPPIAANWSRTLPRSLPTVARRCPRRCTKPIST